MFGDVMQDSPARDKQHQFEAYFMIKHDLQANLRVMDADFELPEVDELVQHMPHAFQVASELASIESKSLRSLRGLADHANELVEIINQQSRKIDLMMSLILQQQTDRTALYTAERFGGAGIVMRSEHVIAVGSIVELRLFIPEESAAIFCYAEAIDTIEVNGMNHVSLLFTCIREQDQDLLVRASLHFQAVNLRKLKQQKNEQH